MMHWNRAPCTSQSKKACPIPWSSWCDANRSASAKEPAISREVLYGDGPTEFYS